MAPSSHVRYSSYRSHDHYQRQRVLQKERAIVSRGMGPGKMSLEGLLQQWPWLMVCQFPLSQHRRREEWSSLGRYLAA